MSKKRTGNSESVPLEHRLLNYVASSWMTQAIYVFAELRIADLLAEGARRSEDLAAITGTHAPSLRRLLRALTTIEICREREDGSFEITPMGSLLVTDVPESLHSWTICWGSYLWQIWGNLLYSVKTGKSARKLPLGRDSFKKPEQDSKAAAMFNQAFVEFTRLASESIVRTYDFSGLKRITDVGGGYGELLISILRASPATSGVLFDLPHVINGGRRRFEEAGLSSRCEFLEGNFLESVPSGADAYILKSIIHDWDDDKNKLILKNCRHAMAKDGRLLLVERVIPERLEVSAAHREVVRSDLTMLIVHAAKERTEAEFRDLLNSAGFRVTRILPVDMMFKVIEAFPL